VLNVAGKSLILRTFAVTIRCVGDVAHSVLKQRTVLCHGGLRFVGGGAAGERREAHTAAEGPAHAVPAGNLMLTVWYLWWYLVCCCGSCVHLRYCCIHVFYENSTY
jgi:hypothetical protein